MKASLLIVSILCIQDITFLQTFVQAQDEGVQCRGYCTDDVQKCKNCGGRIMGFCTNSLACCDPLIHSAIKCGEVKSGQRIVDFKSPDYPSFRNGDLSCQVKIEILKDNVATRVDFIHVEMEGPSFSESENDAGACESDMIFLRGFETWAPPPRCGNFSVAIDGNTPQSKNMKSLSILALMASPAYRWHIRVIQLLKENPFPTYQNSVHDADTPVYNKGKRSLFNHITDREPLDLDEEESKVIENVKGADNRTEIKNDNKYLEKKNLKSVLNGEDTLITSVPWQVSFRYKYESLDVDDAGFGEKRKSNCSKTEGIHFCGGSIIGDKFILTASHCFYGTSKTNVMIHLPFVKAVVGDTNLCVDSENDLMSFDHDIESVTIHYAYDSNLLINDIAVVKLKTPIQFKEYIKPIMLANTGDDFSEQEALLSGWGDYINPNNDDESEEEITPPFNFTSSSEATTFATTLPTEMSTTLETDLENDTDTTSSTSPSNTTPNNGINIPTEAPYTSTTTSSSQPDESPPPLEEKLELETPNILQSSRRFKIQNRTVCNAKDIEQYSATRESVLRYTKYYFVFDSTICTSSVSDGDDDNYRPVSTGKGDSGGPLVTLSESNPVQVGVVSYGIADSEAESCNPSTKSNKTFDFYSSVAFYRNWIDLVVLLSHQNYSHVPEI